MQRHPGAWLLAIVVIVLIGAAFPASAHQPVMETAAGAPSARADMPAVAGPAADAASSGARPREAGAVPPAGSGRPAPAADAARPVPGAAMAMALLVVAVLTAARLRPFARRRVRSGDLGRGAALLLAALLMVIAFEVGVHSTHHVGAPDARCAVASALPHLAATVIEPIAVSPPALECAGAHSPGVRLDIPQQTFSVPDGRAPPLDPSRLA